jgi:hypothetical protein
MQCNIGYGNLATEKEKERNAEENEEQKYNHFMSV